MKVSVSLGCCANNIHSLMGAVNMTFCFHFMIRVSIVIILNRVIMPLIAVVGMLHNQLCGSGQQGCTTRFTSMNHCCATTRQECNFSQPQYLCHIYSAWCNTETVLSASWQFLCSVLLFHRWAPLQQRLCLFYMNSTLTLLTTNHVDRGVREQSKPPSWEEEVPFKICQSLC